MIGGLNINEFSEDSGSHNNLHSSIDEAIFHLRMAKNGGDAMRHITHAMGALKRASMGEDIIREEVDEKNHDPHQGKGEHISEAPGNPIIERVDVKDGDSRLRQSENLTDREMATPLMRSKDRIVINIDEFDRNALLPGSTDTNKF